MRISRARVAHIERLVFEDNIRYDLTAVIAHYLETGQVSEDDVKRQFPNTGDFLIEKANEMIAGESDLVWMS